MNFPLRGGPDNQAPGYQIAGAQVDPGLASEFTSLELSRLDSLGRPFIFDDFSGGLVDCIIGGTVQSYGNAGYAAPQCAEITAGGSPATITKNFVMPPSYRIGLEVAFYVNAAGTPGGTISIELKNKANNFDALLAWNGVAFRIQIAGGTFVSLGSTLHGQEWTRLKLIADFLNGVYVAAIIPSSAPNQQRVTLNQALFAPGLGTPSFSAIVTASSTVQPIFIGYMLVTVDEP